MEALVIGGTGPTGPFVVNGLRERGYRVTILHTGNHETEAIPDEVEHIHVDPWDVETWEPALGGRNFDVCMALYGRLRRVAEFMRGRCGRFVSVGGVPAYRGFMNPALLEPEGLFVPIGEGADRVRDESEDFKGYRIARTEDEVLRHQPEATHFRYPVVYGPRQPMPREWCVVRRVLDGRSRIILPDEGLTLCHCGYAENLAHALLLAVDHPDSCAGRIYNCGDEDVLTLRQTVEVLASALGHAFELISMPYSLALPARPMVMAPFSNHRVLDLSRLRADLGYRDRVPAREGLAITARWLAENPPEPGGNEEMILQDPFDYAAEDHLMDSWQRFLAEFPRTEFSQEPGYTLSYSGPGGFVPSSSKFK